MKMNKNMKKGIELAEEKYLPMLDQKQEELDEVRETLDGVRVELTGAKAEAEGAKAEAEGAKAEAEGAKAEAESAKAEAESAKAEAEHAKERAELAEERAELAEVELEIADEKLDGIEADLQNIREQIFSKMNMAKKESNEYSIAIEEADNEIKKDMEAINFDINSLPEALRDEGLVSQMQIRQLQARNNLKANEEIRDQNVIRKQKAEDEYEAALAEIGKLFIKKFGTRNVYGELEY